jgi:uncharacterized protein YjbJ (UPF0337 family)
MDKDRIQGAGKQVKGSMKEAIGKRDAAGHLSGAPK